MILGDVGVHNAAEPMIDQRLLVQCHADAPHHASQGLAGRGLGVQDPPGGDRADDTRDADYAELFVDLYLGKDRRASAILSAVVRYVAGHGENHVATAALVCAVLPLMVKTPAPADCLKVFLMDSAQLGANRTQFYRDFAAGPFYNHYRTGQAFRSRRRKTGGGRA
jgi:hypothetical protein